MDILKLFPDTIYAFIGYGFIALVWLVWKFKLYRYVRVELPDEFMKHFRWITPLELQILVIANGFLIYAVWKMFFAIQSLEQAIKVLP